MTEKLVCTLACFLVLGDGALLRLRRSLQVQEIGQCNWPGGIATWQPVNVGAAVFHVAMQ